MLDNEKWWELIYRHRVWHSLLLRVSDELPDIRNIRIQSDKLRRLLSKDPVPHASPSKILAGKVSTKKYRKKHLHHSQQVAEQQRKLEKMVMKCFKEWLRKTHTTMN